MSYPDTPTPDDLDALDVGDRVTVHYNSVYTDADEHRTFDAEVLDVEDFGSEFSESTIYTVTLDHEGSDERRYDDEADRRFEAAFLAGEFVYADVETRNGARWNRLSELHPNPTIEVAP